MPKCLRNKTFFRIKHTWDGSQKKDKRYTKTKLNSSYKNWYANQDINQPKFSILCFLFSFAFSVRNCFWLFLPLNLSHKHNSLTHLLWYLWISYRFYFSPPTKPMPNFQIKTTSRNLRLRIWEFLVASSLHLALLLFDLSSCVQIRD